MNECVYFRLEVHKKKKNKRQTKKKYKYNIQQYKNIYRQTIKAC